MGLEFELSSPFLCICFQDQTQKSFKDYYGSPILGYKIFPRLNNGFLSS